MFPVLLFFLLGSLVVTAQDIPLFQPNFDRNEFTKSSNKIVDAIGNKSIAIVQSGASGRNFEVFRQTNEIYYLCRLEKEQAYLLPDGRNKKTTLLLPHRNSQRERDRGKTEYKY